MREDFGRYASMTVRKRLQNEGINPLPDSFLPLKCSILYKAWHKINGQLVRFKILTKGERVVKKKKNPTFINKKLPK